MDKKRIVMLGKEKHPQTQILTHYFYIMEENQKVKKK
jgi:hypothetical protein